MIVSKGDKLALRKAGHFFNVPGSRISPARYIMKFISFFSDRIFTCSVDQRVSLWKISSSDVGGEKNVFELIWQSFSNVPDLHDMVTLKKLDHVFVVVVGAGMQIFKLKL